MIKYMDSVSTELVNVLTYIICKYKITFDIKVYYDSYRGDYDNELVINYDLLYKSLCNEYGMDLAEILWTAIDCIGFEDIFIELQDKRLAK